jgi:hypothetical protein
MGRSHLCKQKGPDSLFPMIRMVTRVTTTADPGDRFEVNLKVPSCLLQSHPPI